MSARTARWLAPLLGGVTLLLGLVWAGLMLLNVDDGLRGNSFDRVDIPLELLGTVVYVAVGTLVATRRPENPIGWLLLLFALLTVIPQVATQYAAAALLGDRGWPGGLAIAVALKGGWVPEVFILVLVVLLFPTGRLLSHRWRSAVWVAAVSLTALMILSHFGSLDPPFTKHHNPIAIDAGHVLPVVVGAPVILGLLGSLVAAFACPVVRFRRAKGDEREQLKWFFLAAAVLPLGFVVHLAAETFFPSALDTVERGFSLAIVLLPITMGVAILKYRLYDVDRIISRALVYGALTIVLALAYVGLVLAGQAVFSSFAGGSNLVIAVSTLVVAALFLPVRSRVQRVVDRRFYRRRYDAQRTLEAFGARLRHRVELDGLDADLRAAVRETVQPTQVAVWLRGGGERV